jgi:hypothetical protein
MANYLLAYHGGGMPETPEEQANVMKAWEAWFGSIGAGVVDGGNPIGQTKTIASNGRVSDGGGANPITGYSVIKADNFDAAVQIASGCPILKSGGNIELCETFNVM